MLGRIIARNVGGAGVRWRRELGEVAGVLGTEEWVIGGRRRSREGGRRREAGGAARQLPSLRKEIAGVLNSTLAPKRKCQPPGLSSSSQSSWEDRQRERVYLLRLAFLTLLHVVGKEGGRTARSGLRASDEAKS